MGISGNQWGSVGISGDQWESVGISGNQWGSVGISGDQWRSDMLLDGMYTLSVAAAFSIRSHFARPGGAGKRKTRKTKSAEVGALMLLIMKDICM